MDYNFDVGQQLIVELITREIYEGEYVSGSENRVELKNVREHTSKNDLDGLVVTFYRNEISSIHFLKERNKLACNNSSPTPGCKDIITLPRSEYKNLKGLAENYIYMSTMDSRYFDAVKHLSECETVGVVGLSDRLGRSGRLNLLVCSAWDQVYIFDLFLYNKKGLPKELKVVLEADEIRKVLHDSRPLVDSLCYCYETHINNIFDTQVADVFIEKKKTNKIPERIRNLGQCLSEYFNFPESHLERALNAELSLWKKRPLNDSIKLMASHLVVYLITLKNHMEKLLLKEFYEQVDCYSTSSLDTTAVEAQNLFGNKNVAEVLSSLAPEEKVH